MAGRHGRVGRHAAGPGENQNWDLEDCPGNPEALCGIHGGARLCPPFRRTCCREQVTQPPAAAFRSNTCQGLASLPHSPRSGCSHTRTELGGAPRATRAWCFCPPSAPPSNSLAWALLLVCQEFLRAAGRVGPFLLSFPGVNSYHGPKALPASCSLVYPSQKGPQVNLHL